MIPVIFLLVASLCCSLSVVAVDSEAQARRLINALGCKACHSLEQSGSILAPSLDKIGARMDLKQLTEKLTIHKEKKPKTAMPSYATTPDQDLTAIVIFLASLK